MTQVKEPQKFGCIFACNWRLVFESSLRFALPKPEDLENGDVISKKSSAMVSALLPRKFIAEDILLAVCCILIYCN